MSEEEEAEDEEAEHGGRLEEHPLSLPKRHLLTCSLYFLSVCQMVSNGHFMFYYFLYQPISSHLKGGLRAVA